MRKKSVFVSHISDETELAQWLKVRLLGDFLNVPEIFVSSGWSHPRYGLLSRRSTCPLAP
jgi:hypothetical protein